MHCKAKTKKGICGAPVKENLTGCGRHPAGLGVGDDAFKLDKKTRVREELKVSLSHSFMDRVSLNNFAETDYDYGYGGFGGDCDCDSIHRCSTITNARVVSVDVKRLSEYVAERYATAYQFDNIELLRYCFERLFIAHKLYDTNDWDVNVVNGYYGEEIGNTIYTGSKTYDIQKILNDLFSQPVTSKSLVEMSLIAEYGNLLNWMKDPTVDYTVETVDLNKISFPNTDYLRKIDNSRDVYSEDYFKRNPILGLVSNDLTVVDGYHRISLAKSDKLKKVKVIVSSSPRG